jgi:hypothetical protein
MYRESPHVSCGAEGVSRDNPVNLSGIRDLCRTQLWRALVFAASHQWGNFEASRQLWKATLRYKDRAKTDSFVNPFLAVFFVFRER